VNPEEEARVVLVVDVDSLTRPDLAVVDALARLQLAARRLGGTVRIRHASKELEDLITFAGLAGVLPGCGRSGGELGGEPKQREQLLVDEERDAADPPV
jgi:hypothetical protein